MRRKGGLSKHASKIEKVRIRIEAIEISRKCRVFSIMGILHPLCFGFLHALTAAFFLLFKVGSM